KSMNRDHSEELTKDLAKARKKKKKSRESPKMPPGSPPHQPPHPPPPADRWKPLEEERPATSEPAWSIPSSDVPVPTNNWASSLASNYSPTPKDSLLAQTGDIAMFMDWFCKRQGITELKPQDLEGLAFEIIKVFHPDQMVPDQMWNEEECKYDIAAIIEFFSMYGYDYMKKIVLRRTNLNEHVIAERDF
nr:hypothetical protein [Tanacetum cinerariifolium]